MAQLIPIVAILCVFGVPVVAIICGTVLSLKKKETSASRPEEIKMIQEIHHGLARMEQRIDALETILYDQKKDG